MFVNKYVIHRHQFILVRNICRLDKPCHFFFILKLLKNRAHNYLFRESYRMLFYRCSMIQGFERVIDKVFQFASAAFFYSQYAVQLVTNIYELLASKQLALRVFRIITAKLLSYRFIN